MGILNDMVDKFKKTDFYNWFALSKFYDLKILDGNKDSCLFCREKILDGASICIQCGNEQLDDEEIVKLLVSNVYLSFPYFWVLVYLMIGLAIHSSIFGIGFLVFFIFLVVRLNSVKPYYEKKNGAAFVLLSKLQRCNEREKRKFSSFGKFIGIVFILFFLFSVTNPTVKDIREHIESKNDKLRIINFVEEDSVDLFFLSIHAVDLEVGEEEKRQYYLRILDRIHKVDWVDLIFLTLHAFDLEVGKKEKRQYYLGMLNRIYKLDNYDKFLEYWADQKKKWEKREKEREKIRQNMSKREKFWDSFFND